MKILLFVIIFVCLSAFLIISNNNLYIGHSEDLNKFVTIYRGWLGGLGGNIATISGDVATLTGNAVKLDWMPKR